MTRPQMTGDGDLCPEDPAHGHMWMTPNKARQWCPHADHKGFPFYQYDGVTQAESWLAASQTAPDLARVQGRPTAQITAQ